MPADKKVTNLELLEEIRDLNRNFAADLASEILKMKEEFRCELNQCKEEMFAQVSQLECKVKELSSKVLHLEGHGRRLNIIVTNVAEDKAENTETVIRDFLIKNLEINSVEVNKMSFRDCHRLPKPKNAHPGVTKNHRPIIVAFTQQYYRNMVMDKANLLRGSNITIKSDLPKEWDEVRNQLLQQRRLLINEGKMVRLVERSYKPILQIKIGEKWTNYNHQ